MMVAHEITPPRCGGKASPLPALFSSLDFPKTSNSQKTVIIATKVNSAEPPAGASQMPTCCTDKSRQA
jgi:hypothetical protein